MSRRFRAAMAAASCGISSAILFTVSLVCISGCGASPPASSVTTPTPVKVPTVVAASPANVSPVNSKTQPAAVAGTILKFRDATRDWRVNFTRYDDMRGENRNMEANGGGIAVVDYDLDGQLDLFFTQGGKLPLKTFPQDLSNELFRNRNGSIYDTIASNHFDHVTASAGLTQTGFHTGVAVGDVNADGFSDLYVNSYGRSSLWVNLGDGTFREGGDESHATVDTWGASVALADLNGDGFLDLYIATYLKVGDDPPLICKEPRSPTGTTQCSPTLIPALDDILLVNDGQGGFIDVSKAAGITAPDGKGLGVAAIDINGDGKLDIHVANDMAPSFLYVNETPSKEPPLVPGTNIILPRFQERGTEFGIALNGEGRATAAMGIAQGDYDRDGWVDLFVTNFYLEVNTLFKNQAGQGFSDFSSTSRLGPPSRNTLAFGTEFFDIDHDGWLDLVVTTGHIEDRTYTKTEPYRMRPHLFRNERNGRFTDVAATGGTYFSANWVGRTLATGDIDRDGDLDLVMAQQVDSSVLLLNETQKAGTSVVIKPVGRNGSPRDGIGTRITASRISPVLMRVLAGGCSFQAASAQEFHLPLCQPAFEELMLEWPDGQIDRWQNVTAGYYVAIEGQGLVRVPGVESH